MRHYFNWKYILLAIAIIIAIAAFFQLHIIVKAFEQEEKHRMQLHIHALRTILEDSDNPLSQNPNPGFVLATRIIDENKTIPIIITDAQDKIIGTANLDSTRILANAEYLQEKLVEFKQLHGRIVLDDGYNITHYYYGDSEILSKLKLYPYLAASVIGVFILILFVALRNAQKSIQNQVWVGMSKETAHQLGTPLTSIVAWMELLKEQESNRPYIEEMEKDVERLQLIADRFSKIGSVPQLMEENLILRLENMVDYMQKRAPNKVKIKLETEEPEVEILLIGPLFDWVIENLIRNALDAMEGEGEITIKVSNQPRVVTIDICDTGKGIPKNKYKKIFQPGYSTKMRGWGLGLSLAKRIINQYHNGSIFVKHSELGKGTSFRILLRR